MKKTIAFLLAVTLLAACLTACSKGNGGQDGGSGEADKLRIALVLPGKKDDVSFNQAMYRGAMEFAEKNADTVELKVTEGVYDVADIDPTLRDYADNGYDVIIGHGYQFSEPVNTVAKQYGDCVFLLGCGVGYQPNSACYDVQLEAGGYLMGVIAALATQSNKIGVIGGGEGSEITRGHEGFKAGAKSVNPGVDIQEVYTGDWNDTTGAYEAAIGMYDSGVDVIWHSGDGIGLGVVQAAEEKDMYVLGNVEDQKTLAPQNVLGGLQYEWGNALERIFSTIRDGSFISDGEKETYMINVENGGLSMTEINDVKGWLTEEDLSAINDVYEKLGKNEIALPEI
ncbi:BMP family protein [Oscillibacter sp.]|jgi:basic membrane protein A|uniref:BMP family protein n=1 Tax=Oscillibacter sp. TaxID=1945593 RepID=UPI00216BFBE5|nr:BMP family protein [Oscillibacter sp.]MCI9648324.1 BMP family ABC transporter substrate-binding protein [Oscillibacter sp.]